MGFLDKLKYMQFNQIKDLIPHIPQSAEYAFRVNEVEVADKSRLGWREKYEGPGVVYLNGSLIGILAPTMQPIEVPILSSQINQRGYEINVFTEAQKYELEHPGLLSENAPPEALPVVERYSHNMPQSEKEILQFIYDYLIQNGAQSR